jgi:2-oxoglutarate dehydrogenase E1 component
LVGSDVKLTYVGRPESASPAEGSLKQHVAEQSRIIRDALRGAPVLNPRKEKVSHAR